MIRLILRYPNNVVQEVEFEQPRYRIGTAEDNDLVLDQEGVSPHQAEIEETDGSYTLVDASEDSSTTINGKTIERSNINYGDRIAFGPVTALCYPIKKSRVGARAKMFMYMGAGALVIIASIVLIFFLMSRQISSVVTGGFGEVPVTEEAGVKAETIKPERGEKRPLLARDKETAPVRPISREELVLPEPPQKEIEKRMAVAVPRGIGRLFFRKIPVVVEQEEAETVPEEVVGGAVTEDTAVGGEAALEESKGGIFRTVLSSLNKLLNRKDQEQGLIGDYEEEAEGEEIVTVFEETEAPVRAPAVEETKKEEAVRTADFNRVVNPLEILTAMDIPALREEMFEEKPIYEQEEIEGEQEPGSLMESPLSEAETMNVDITWRYPEGAEKVEPILRSGAVLRMDRRGSLTYLVGTKDGVLLAVNSTTGEDVFSEDLGKPFYDPMVEDMDRDRKKEVIVVFEDGDIAVLTTELERLWYYDGEDSVTSMPALFDINGDKTNDIVFATLNMDIVALDGTSGFEIWRFFDSESEIVHSPAAVEANGDSVLDVLFTTEMGYLYLLEGKTGWTLWKNPIYGRPAGTPAIADLDGDRTDEIVVLTRNGFISSYKTDGKLLFTWELQGRFSTSPSIGDIDGDGINEIVLVDESGIVRALEGRTRAEEWVFETDEGGPLGRVALADLDKDGGLEIIFCTFSGALFVLDGTSGSQIATFNYGSHVLATPIVVDVNRAKGSEIIAGTYSGEVFALNVSDVKPKLFAFKKSSWSVRNHDYRNTGHAGHYFWKNPWK